MESQTRRTLKATEPDVPQPPQVSIRHLCTPESEVMDVHNAGYGRCAKKDFHPVSQMHKANEADNGLTEAWRCAQSGPCSRSAWTRTSTAVSLSRSET